jgi:hypothetical protein
MNGEVLTGPCAADQPVLIEMIEGPHANNPRLRELIYRRGMDPDPAETAKSLAALSEATGTIATPEGQPVPAVDMRKEQIQ